MTKLLISSSEKAILKKNEKFKDFNQKTIAEKIQAIREVYQELEKINWSNKKKKKI